MYGWTPRRDFLKMNQDWIEQSLTGATVLVDNQFKWAKKHTHSIKFVMTFKWAQGNSTTGVADHSDEG